MSVSGIVRALAVGPPAVHVARSTAPDGVVLEVPAAHVRRVCELLRDEPEGRYDLLLAIVPDGAYVRYQIASLSHRRRLRLRIAVAHGDPPVDSVAFVWPAANWAEREAQDLSDVRFRAHPNPTPLVCEDHAPAPRAVDVGWHRSFASGTRFPSGVDGLEIEVECDGNQVVRATPHLSLLHVGVGARIARGDYRYGTRIAARLDAYSAMAADLAYALAIERLLGIEVPPRAQLLRALYAELQRTSSHLSWLAKALSNLAGPAFAAPAYALRAREAILDLFQWLGGNPIMPDVIAIGGLRGDAPEGLVAYTRDLVADLTALLEDLDALLAGHSGIQRRLEGVGVIDRGTAVGLGITGPALRACGIPYDVRSAFPYAAYDALSVELPIAYGGDAWARTDVRRRELRGSLDLLRQCLSRLVPGPIRAIDARDLPPDLPCDAVYAGVEGPRGELGMLVAAGGAEGLRVHVRGPSFAALSALPYMVSGLPVDQLALLIDSLDLSACEAAR